MTKTVRFFIFQLREHENIMRSLQPGYRQYTSIGEYMLHGFQILTRLASAMLKKIY